MIANLPLDGDVNDIAGKNNHGTVTGTETYTAGPKVRQAFDGDGSSYVTLANESNFDFEHSDPFSVSFWIKSTDDGFEHGIINKLEWVVNAKGWRVTAGDTYCIFRITDNHSVTDIALDVGDVRDGTWHHVLFTYDGSGLASGISGYLDGVSTGSGSGSLGGTTCLNNFPVRICTNTGGAPIITAQIADVQVWDKELSLTEVLRIRNEPQLLSNHTLDGVVTDSEGDNDGTVTGTTSYTSGPKNSKAFDLDGSSYITLANESNFDFEHTQPFSFSFWVKTSSITGDPQMVSKKSGLDTSNGYMVWLWSGGTGQPEYRITCNNIHYFVQASTSITDGNWHFITCTYSGNSDRSGMKVYIDGVLDNTGTSSAMSGTMLNALNLTIGASPSTAQEVTGQIAEVKIWHGELNAEEVKDLYNKSAINVQYDIDAIGAVRTTPERSTFEFNRKLSLNMK